MCEKPSLGLSDEFRKLFSVKILNYGFVFKVRVSNEHINLIISIRTLPEEANWISKIPSPNPERKSFNFTLGD